MVYRDPTPLDPDKEYTAEELADFILEKMYGKHTREAMARALLKANEVAESAVKLAHDLLDESFDETALNAEIERRLDELEQEYAPELTIIKNEVEDARGNESTLGDRLDGVSSQLAQKAEKEDLDDVSSSLSVTSEKVVQIEDDLTRKADDSDLGVERSRINNLVTHANDTDGNSELLDIRVGFEGTSYQSAGDAVRNSIEQVKNVLFGRLPVTQYDAIATRDGNPQSFPPYLMESRSGGLSGVVHLENNTSYTIKIRNESGLNRFRIYGSYEKIEQIPDTGSLTLQTDEILYDDNDSLREFTFTNNSGLASIFIYLSNGEPSPPYKATIDVSSDKYKGFDLELSHGRLKITDDKGRPVGKGVSFNSSGGFFISGYPKTYVYDGDITINPSGLSTQDILDIYESCRDNYPNYITREFLGRDDFSNDIHSYTIEKQMPKVTDDIYGDAQEVIINPPKMTILINSGTHGNEKGSALFTALFVKELCESNDDLIRFIRNNATVKVIPVLSPSGFDDNTRDNRNNVNINRDFFDVTQPETRIAIDFVNDNKGAIVLFDCHNTVGDMSFWNIPENEEMHELFFRTFSNLEDQWIDHDPSLAPHAPLGELVLIESETLKDYCYQLGISSTTIESCRHTDSMKGMGHVHDFDTDSVRFGLEMLANSIISMMLKHS